MNDLDRFLSMHFRTSLSSASDMEYMRPNGGLAPSVKWIGWSTYREGGSMRASFSKKRTR